MPRRKRPTPKTPPAPAGPPHVIHETAAYSVAQAQAALNLTASTVRRELREGRLRVSKRAGRYFILGKWLIQWIEGGEIRRREPAGQAGRNGEAVLP
jgi:Helix-turn-helix domain